MTFTPLFKKRAQVYILQGDQIIFPEPNLETQYPSPGFQSKIKWFPPKKSENLFFFLGNQLFFKVKFTSIEQNQTKPP